MIGAVIFDLDGTLLNTLDDLTAAIDHALIGLSRESLTAERVRRFVGNGVPKLIKRALFYTSGMDSESAGVPDMFDECLEMFTEYYNEHSADRTRLYDGIKDMLKSLNVAHVKTAVVTNKYDAAAQALKEKFFPEVDFIVGTRDGIRPKPAPDGVERALKALGAERSDCIYVGDGETDIATAKNCGLPVAAVTWGFRDRDELAALSPDHIVDSPRELLDLLERLGAKGGMK